MSARKQAQAPALAWIEESIQLLRRAPIEAFAIYYAGTVPFVLGLLFFWAHTTWFLPSGAEVAWGALGLTLLFVLMKALQSEFCARLSALRLGAPQPAWSWRRLGAVALAQVAFQPWALLATAVSTLLAVPLGWVYAYGQIATVVGSGETLHRDATAHALRWPGSNHLALLMIGGVAVCLWANLFAAFITIPMLANRLLGIDNVFGLQGWALANTTFLASVTAVAWLAIDPLVKAFYTLWVFYGSARRTGDDIRVELRRSRAPLGSCAARVVAVALVCMTLAPMERLHAQTKPPPQAVQPERLGQAIERVLEKPEFSWRLRPVHKPVDEAREGPIRRFFKQGATMLQDGLRWIGRKLRSVVDWIVRHLAPDRFAPAAPEGSETATGLLKILLFAFIAAAILLIAWVIWVVYRRARCHVKTAVAANAGVSAAPDLSDENVQAAQLPEDGWLALAREQASRGEWRLALRALYLAMLARLAAEGLISLARFKTNLDYERELRRRALSRLDLVGHFTRRRRAFEAVWYGRELAAENEVREWMADFERPGPP